MRTLKSLLVAIVVMLSAFSASAETKEYANGEVTAYYSGNRAEIVDNVNNVCVIVTINRTDKNSAGEWLYEMACDNKVTKNLTKFALRGVIDSAVAAVSSPIIAAVADQIAMGLYDEACQYFAD